MIFQGLLQVKTKCTTKLEDCSLRSSDNSVKPVSRQTKLVLCGGLFRVQIGQRDLEIIEGRKSGAWLREEEMIFEKFFHFMGCLEIRKNLVRGELCVSVA